MNKYCVYTCITGNYDNLHEVENKDDRIDYICFTNNKNIKSNTWDVRYIDIKNEDHKKVKVKFNEFVGEYKCSLWIDGQIKITSSLYNLIHYAANQEKDLYVFPHTQKNKTIEDELIHINCLGLDDFSRIDKIKSLYDSNNKAKLNEKVYLGGILIRNNTEDCVSAMKEWFNFIDNYCCRDQVSLPIILKKINKEELSLSLIIDKIEFKGHNNRRFEEDIFYSSPFSLIKDIKRSYNEFCSNVPDNKWICITDYDVLFLNDNFHQIICGAIKKYPDTSVFGCYTNRLGLNYQLHEGRISDNDSIIHHKKISKKRSFDYGCRCTEINKPIAGFFLLFNKKIWDKVKFGPMKENGALFDYVFTKKALKHGPIRLIEGLYVFHSYRLEKNNIKDISHLI